VIVGSVEEIGDTILRRDDAEESTHYGLRDRRIVRKKNSITPIGVATLTRFPGGVTGNSGHLFDPCPLVFPRNPQFLILSV
jgi:hypothetical protein